MKVTMVGISGSGKTAYMSALAETMGTSSQSNYGFHISPRPQDRTMDKALLAVGDFNRLSLSQTYQWPDGTTKTTLWPFIVKHKTQHVSYFDWIDYRGGILTDITKPDRNEEEIRDLISHIIASNAVILVVDAFTLSYFSNEQEARRRSGGFIINTLFEVYNEYYPNRDLIFVIMLTKADTVEAKWKANNYDLLIKRGLRVFNQMVELCKQNPSWVGGIVPVSAVGDGNAKRTLTTTGDIRNPILTKDEIVGYPAPQNVEHVLFYCIGHTLRQMRSEAYGTIQQRERELAEALNKATFANRVWSAITGKQSAHDIAQTIMKERNEDYKVLRQIERFVDPLCEIAAEKVRPVR